MKKKMVFAGILLFLLVCLPEIIFAKDGEDRKLGFGGDFTVSREYLGKPGFEIYPYPVVQTTLYVTRGPWRAGTWFSFELNDGKVKHENNYGREIDFFAGLHKNYFNFLEIDLSASYFMIHEPNTSYFIRAKNDIWVLDSQFDFTKVPYVTTYISTRYFGRIGKDSPDPGLFAWIGIKKNISLSNRFNLNLNTALAFSDGALGKNSGFIYSQFQGTLAIKLNDKFSIVPYIHIKIPNGNQNGNSDDYMKHEEINGGISLSFNF